MFKKSFIASALLCCSLVASAAPAKPGVYRTVKLADGTEVKVELRGDERFHFYVDSEGNNYEQTRTGAFRRASIGDLNLRKAMSKRLNSARTTNRQERVSRHSQWLDHFGELCRREVHARQQFGTLQKHCQQNEL